MVNITVETKTYNNVIHALNKAWHDGNECQICIQSKDSLVSLQSSYHAIDSIHAHQNGDIYLSFGGSESLIHHCDHVTYEKLDIDEEAYFDGYSIIYDY